MLRDVHDSRMYSQSHRGCNRDTRRARARSCGVDRLCDGSRVRRGVRLLRSASRALRAARAHGESRDELRRRARERDRDAAHARLRDRRVLRRDPAADDDRRRREAVDARPLSGDGRGAVRRSRPRGDRRAVGATATRSIRGASARGVEGARRRPRRASGHARRDTDGPGRTRRSPLRGRGPGTVRRRHRRGGPRRGSPRAREPDRAVVRRVRAAHRPPASDRRRGAPAAVDGCARASRGVGAELETIRRDRTRARDGSSAAAG